MELSEFQRNILTRSIVSINAVHNRRSDNVINFQIKASAGSGKSFLLGKIFELAYQEGIPLDNIRVLSFVRNLKDDLLRNLKPYVDVSERKELEQVVRTFNSLGMEIYNDALRQWNKLNPDKQCKIDMFDGYKYHGIVQNYINELGWNVFLCSKSQIVKIIDHLREQLIAQPTIDDIKDIVDRFKVKNNIVKDNEFELLHNIVSKSIIQGIKLANPYYSSYPKADFIDHCWLPFLLGESKNPNREMVQHFQYALEDHQSKIKLLLVDEAQDINPILSKMIESLNNDRNCVVIVGDDEQNIYVWRGSESNGMSKLAASLNAESYSLPISYRLPRNHVQMIKSIWTDKHILHHHEQDGQLILLDKSIDDGEYYLNELDNYLANEKLTKLVIGRKNSSIFRLGLKLLSRGHLVKLTGITADAKTYAKQVLGKYKSTDSINFPEDSSKLLEMIESWAVRQKNYLMKSEAPQSDIDQVDDWCIALTSICLNGNDLPNSWEEWEERIDALNSRKKNAIKLSTIHSAKGAEAELVIFADPDCCPLQWSGQSRVELIQEMNALFVALSRTKLSDKDGSGTLLLLTNNPVNQSNGWLRKYADYSTNLEF